MGRPYWAIDPQWAWLMLQSIEYMRIKNTIYPTKSDKWKVFKIFWAKYFEEWARQWPSPGLNAVVKEEPLSEGELCNDDDLPESDGDNAPKQKQTGKQKGPLTVRTVRVQSRVMRNNAHFNISGSSNGSTITLAPSKVKANQQNLICPARRSPSGRRTRHIRTSIMTPDFEISLSQNTPIIWQAILKKPRRRRPSLRFATAAYASCWNWSPRM